MRVTIIKEGSLFHTKVIIRSNMFFFNQRFIIIRSICLFVPFRRTISYQEFSARRQLFACFFYTYFIQKVQHQEVNDKFINNDFIAIHRLIAFNSYLENKQLLCTVGTSEQLASSKQTIALYSRN